MNRPAKNSSNEIEQEMEDSLDSATLERPGAWLTEIIPNPAMLLSMEHHSDKALKDNAVFAFDTSVLFSPLEMNDLAINFLSELLYRLKAKKQVCAPAQVIREYLRGRGRIISKIHRFLNESQKQLYFAPVGAVPVLENHSKFNELKAIDEKILKLLSERSVAVAELQLRLTQWNWEDKVSKLYSAIFDNDTIFEAEEDSKQTQAAHQKRLEQRLPPCIEDAKKQDKGYGDFAIWLQLKNIARKFEKPVVFVTNEKKSDWWQSYKLKGEKQNHPVLARGELVAEFASLTNQQFAVMSFKTFLELMDADEAVVDQANKAEVIVSVIDNRFIDMALLTFEQIRSHSSKVERDGPETYSPLIAEKESLVRFLKELDAKIADADNTMLAFFLQLLRQGVLNLLVWLNTMIKNVSENDLVSAANCLSEIFQKSEECTKELNELRKFV